MRCHLRPSRLLVALLTAAIAAVAPGQVLLDEAPPEMQGVGIEEHLDTRLPLDLEFTDSDGSTVRLGDFFVDDGVPVILTLNFFRCQMLCTLTLNGLVDSIEAIDWSAGKEFRILTLSIASEEGPELADVKKRAYLNRYDRPEAPEGWRFLTGSRESIDRLCDAVGFGFRRLPGRNDEEYDYAHSSSIMFVTPDGRLSRYMNDVQFEPRDVRLALVEASEGAIGSPMEKFLLFTCYRYDPDLNSYAASAVKIMRFAGMLTTFAILAGIGLLWLRGPRGHAVELVESSESPSEPEA